MAKVKYVGTSHYRVITKDDWKSVGVEDQETANWDRDDRQDRKGFSQVVEVSDNALKFLMEKEPKSDFKVVEETPESTTTESTTRRVRDNPQA